MDMNSWVVFALLGIVVIGGLALRGINLRAKIRRWIWERNHRDHTRV